MAIFFKKIKSLNYRCLADVDVELRDVNVLFGPNGAGKSTLLDILWFVRDCAVRGVTEASADRSHGIGLLFDGAAEEDSLSISVESGSVRYELVLRLTGGRIDSNPGERLTSLVGGNRYIERQAGNDTAAFLHRRLGNAATVTLRDPDKLSLGRYLDFEDGFPDVADLDRRLRFIHLYPARQFALRALKRRGSERSHETWLWLDGWNVWSVLSNLQGRSSVDDRYVTILNYMRRAFPSFRDLVLEPTGPSSIYGSFVEAERRRPILASGISDGHMQMLLLLTALFSEGRNRTSLMLFDEPELSLHPWALAVLSEAIQVAAKAWSKQVIVATHSPVLLSQFPASDCLAAEIADGRTRFSRVTDIEGIADLLEQYATGSLYMAETVARQSPEGEELGG